MGVQERIVYMHTSMILKSLNEIGFLIEPGDIVALIGDL